MRYKELFKKWWFWVLFVLEVILNIYARLQVYSYLFLAEYLGIFIGSFINITILVSIGFLIGKGFSKLKKKILRKE